ncbi:MAG: VanZ family protein [Verrucomicrobiota bacterium]
MLDVRKFLKNWLPALVWMALIFTASADTKSYQHSSWLVEPLLRWLFPHMPEEEIQAIHHFLRKCAHSVEYAVLAALLWRALRNTVNRVLRPWDWRVAGLTLSLVFLYAASDEFHQIFVPTRTARVTDVLIDTAGGAAGLFIIWIIGRWRKHW